MPGRAIIAAGVVWLLAGCFASVAEAAPGQLDLAGAANIRIQGAAFGDNAGDSVGDAGDVNDDGIHDVILGGPLASNNGRHLAGSAYVIYGSPTPVDVDLSDLGSAGFRIDAAAANDGLSAVDGAGDFNGDGIDDVVLGACCADNNGYQSGSAYVVYGEDTTDLPDLDLASVTSTAGARGMQVDGAAAVDTVGLSVAGVGDLNGDGMADVAIGGQIRYYVAYGEDAADPADLDLAAITTTANSRGFRLTGASSGTSRSLNGAGDVNDDGVNDLIVGSPGASTNGRDRSGSAFVVYGQNSADLADLDLSTITTTANSRGFRIDGANDGGINDRAGTSVAGLGDVNGDDVGDVAVGVVNTDYNGRTDSGSAYVIYGQGTPDPSDVDLAGITAGSAARGFRLDGQAAVDRAGQSVAGPGDINGDGVNDVLTGSADADNNGREDSGSAYLVYGEHTADPTDLDLANLTGSASSRGLRVDGEAPGDSAGLFLSGAGDFNSDGHPDLLIGAPHANVAGAAYIPALDAQAAPSSVGFGGQRVGTESSGQTVTLWNPLGSALDVSGVGIAGVDANQFSILADGCTGQTLDAGETCTVQVAFAPTGSPGSRVARLEFSDSAATSPQTVSLTGVASPDPDAVDDSASLGEDSGPTAIPVLDNDTDSHGDPITIESASDPLNGSVVVAGDGQSLTYQPDANYCNSPPGTTPDTFTYAVNGGDTATVSVTVNCLDDPPVAVDDGATVAENAGPSAIDVLANDTDIDGGPKLISAATDPAHGTVVVAGDGLSLTYQPDANYCNLSSGPQDTFTYSVSGGDTAIVSLSVTCVSPRIRYAAPDGDGAQPCLQADPCSYKDAVLGVGADKPVDGDEVVIAPGDYAVSGSIHVPVAIHLHGEAGQPRPRIIGTGVPLYMGAGGLVNDLTIVNQNGTGLELLNGADAERVKVTASTGGACYLDNLPDDEDASEETVLRDSVCATAGDSPAILSAAGSNVQTSGTIRLRNVTAISTGPTLPMSSSGVAIDIVSLGGVTTNVDAKNVIARGNTFDLQVRSDDDPLGGKTIMDLSNSNFATRDFDGDGEITPPTEQANQSQPPEFVDTANGDFHETPDSPTLDAGATDSFVSSADIDGADREQGFAPDMGAYESPDQLPPPAAPVVLGVTPTGPADNNTPRVFGTSAPDTTVQVFAGPSCGGDSLATGSEALFASPGLTLTVPDNSTTTIHAIATDRFGQASTCSSTSATYVELTPPPVEPVTPVAPDTPLVPSNPVRKHCKKGKKLKKGHCVKKKRKHRRASQREPK